ncbi:Na/Pi symporter [Sutcliffiella horikoshii]|uniref:Na/Pi symporter n=1 Tax=Sutcliffiella horikoshii TaxID=79883 RepID=UPI003CE97D6B
MGLFSIITLLAVYLAIFLIGMTVMRSGLLQLSEKRTKGYLTKFTDMPWKGLLIGILITGLLQSSSAVMVITVGLVAAGYLTFYQSIGIMLGSNIGSTFITELITIDISQLIFPMLIIGFLFLFSKKKLPFSFGSSIFGLGCLFVAMNGFESLAIPLAGFPSVQDMLAMTNDHHLFGVGIGTLLTAIIQSSSATTGISMSFLNNDLLSLPAGIAIMLGANIGTCVTAFLASIGSIREAKLTAYAHIWLNVIGVAVFFPWIPWLSGLVSMLASSADVQLAHSSLIFNVISSALALPFVRPFARFVERLHG